MTADKRTGIYIHIPFCLRKCAYCDFYSLPVAESAENYFEALKRNISIESDRTGALKIDSIYIGGGTPSCVDGNYIFTALEELGKRHIISSDCEISIECNPKTIDNDKLTAYKSAGINRISIGMQSCSDEELKSLGRIHSYNDFLESYELVRKCGFNNVNVDIMTGIPRQSICSSINTFKNVISLAPEHISSYMLKIEKSTEFYKNRKKYAFPSEETVCDIFSVSHDLLSKNGYEHYEISNFAKKGFECRHNIRYWKCDDCISFGPAAHSYYGGIRYSYKKDIVKYIKSRDFSDIIDDFCIIGENESCEEKIIFGLRMSEGIDKALLDGYDCKELLENYASQGYCVIKDGRLSLTVKGMLISNYIISDILLTEKN